MARPELTQLQFFEILDRVKIIGDNINENLLQHPVCKLQKSVSGPIEQALENLYKSHIEIHKIIKETF